MKNITRLAASICKDRGNILIHTILNTKNWLICQKIAPNKWSFTLSNPTGNITHNLGTTSNQTYFPIWNQLTKEFSIASKCSQFDLAKELKNRITKLNKDLNSSGFILKNFLNNNIAKIQIPNTDYWIWGEQKDNLLWDTYLVHPNRNYKETLRKNVTTKSFKMFSTIILKTPFEITTNTVKTLKYFINNLI